MKPNGPVKDCLCPDGDMGIHYPACKWHGKETKR